uniref:Cell division protein FtsK n=1 Tax=Candidatus Komeilibacteria bacterium CG_4_10_14_0_8_um_filter_37_78 TaxID=1974471 RepID=A0A2M7RC10_9BACT|nr:MAG: cell division protein FtsK [Candidatus Komeilibacteria bacterium CG_4_10_14_0_8_um_filter_37_78]
MASNKKKKRHYRRSEILSPETKKGIFIIIIFLIALLSLLSMLDLAGNFGLYVKAFLGIIFGWGRWLVAVLLLIWGYILINPDKYLLKPSNYIGLIFVVLSSTGILEIIHNFSNTLNTFVADKGGGYLGFAVAHPLQGLMGSLASLVILLGLLIIAILISFNISLDELGNKINIFKLIWWRFKSWSFNKNNDYEEDYDEGVEEEDDEEQIEDDTEVENDDEQESKPPIKTPEKGALQINVARHLPKVVVPLDLLDANSTKPTSIDIESNAEIIRRTFDNFNIEVTMDEVNVGPTVTQFTMKPSEGVKLSQITNLSNDLALALAAHPIRIEAPIPGRSLVGIEVPNKKIAVVKLREVLESESFKSNQGNLVTALGKDVSGQCHTTNIAKMPHCLIAGSTNSGKSVCINNFIISLLYRNNPDELRFIMVDPKRIELSIYNNIPHLLTPVITEVPKTINALRWAVNEMDERYKLLQSVNKKDIAGYNQSVLVNRLPYIVIVIDELADLMAVAAREVEAAIIRLAQMARASGIHLVIATQRPSTNVITGLIKANITNRLAFKVASQIDSRTILDSGGAEKLLGNGDMLFISPEFTKPRRLQGAFVSEKEIKRVTDFWREQDDPDYKDEIVERQKGVNVPGSALIDDDDDELLPDAQDVVLKAGKASASLLQRRLRVGYARAARLLDLLEERGIIGPSDGAKPREILLRQDDLEENLDMREYDDGWVDEEIVNEQNNNNETETEIEDENEDDEEED